MKNLFVAVIPLLLAGCSSLSDVVPLPSAPIAADAISDHYLHRNHRFIATRTLPISSNISEHGYSGYYTRFIVSAINSDGEVVPAIPSGGPSNTATNGDNEERERNCSFTRDDAGNLPAELPAELPDECVRGASATSGLRNYAAESRVWWQRWYAGHLASKTAQLHINVSAPNVSSSATLAAFTHESTRETGERFETDVRHHTLATPFFRIQPDATVELQLEFNLGYTVSSETVGAVLSTATTALNVLGPKSTLLTELNREEVNNAAGFLDSTLSSVLNEDITERLQSTHGIEDWLSGQVAVFEIRLPRHHVRRIRDIAPDSGPEVGEWRVELELPRTSIFSDYSPCVRIARRMHCPQLYQYRTKRTISRLTLEYRARDLQGSLAYLTSAEALDFKLANDVSLGTYLRDREWFTDAVSRFNGAAGDAQEATHATFCRQVMRAATDVGMNSIDAHVALWAILGEAAVTPAARRDALLGGCAQEGGLMRLLQLRGM